MSNRSFGARTFKSRTFRSRTWAGLPATTNTLSAASGNFSLSGKTSLFNDKIAANYRSLNFSSTTTTFLNKLSSSTDVITLSGRSSNFSINSVNSYASFNLSGKTNRANLIFPSLTTSYGLSGRSALFNQLLSSLNGNYLLSGKSSAANRLFSSARGNYSLTGKTANFNYSNISSQGSYSLSGKTSLPNRLFTSGSGNYSLAGKTALNTLRFATQRGLIDFTGNDVDFITFSGSMLVASRGTFSLSGNALFNLKVAANSTNYFLAGKSSTANRLFTSARGNYSLTGETNNFNYLNRSFAGSYSLSGPAIINLVKLTGQHRSIILTGNSISFNPKIVSNSVNYLLSGKPALVNLLFSSARGSYSLNGRNAAFNYSIISSRGSFSLTGKNALNILRFAAQQGSIVFTGNDAELISLIFGYILSANRGLFTLSGKSAQLIAQYNQLASPDYTRLKGFIDIGKSLIMDQLSDNLIMFFNWSLLNVGAFTNISRPDSINPFGDRSKLRLVEEPNYVAGRVWEGFQGNWVWESGLYYPILPFVPAIYVNNTLVTTGFKINYPLGRVIFDVSLDADSVVEAKFSVRRYNFYPSNVPWFKQILFASYLANDPHFLETAQGKWADILGQNRITLPAVVVEVSPRRNMRGLQLGGGHWVDIDVLFHIFAEDSWDRDKLIDIISMQREKTIILFDKNALLAADDYPLNDYGDVKTTAKMYPTLLEDYSWKRCFFKDIVPQDVMSLPPLYRGVARLTCEIDFPEF